MKLDAYLLSKNERLVYGSLTVQGVRPRDIWRKLGIPHASLYLAFAKLVTRGLAKRFTKEGKLYWKLEEQKDPSSPVIVHTELHMVRRLVLNILKLSPGNKVTIVEGTQRMSGWFDLFSKAETIQLNRKLSKRRIICESILPENYFKDAVPQLGSDWAKSYRDRPVRTFLVRKGLISSDALLIILHDRAILLYAKEVLAIEIKHKEVVALIQGMVEAVKEYAKPVHISPSFAFE